MAPHRFLPLTVLITGLSMGYSSIALEAMDDASLSATTGQAAGLRITQEYENRIDSIEYWDDNGWGENGTVGNITINHMVVRTPSDGREVKEYRIVETNGVRSLEIKDVDYKTETYIDAIRINGKSLGSLGTDNYNYKAGAVRKTILRPGGYEEGGVDIGGDGGLSVDTYIPASLTYDSWTEQNGVRKTHTVSYDDIYRQGKGGYVSLNATTDITEEGLRLGFAEVTNGYEANVNLKIGDHIHGTTAKRNITYAPGGYVLLKSAKETGDIGLEADLVLKAKNSDGTINTGWEQLEISGEIVDFVNKTINGTEGASYLTTSNLVSSTQIRLKDDLKIQGMRLNVDGERGVVLDFDETRSATVVAGRPEVVAEARIEMADHKLMQGGGDMITKTGTTPSLGTYDVRLNLTNQSYIQIEGR